MRERIVQAATESIKKYGLRGFTLDDITGELSMSKKTIYKYFTSKNELISEIVQRAAEIEKQRVLQEVDRCPTWFEKLNAILSVYSYPAIPFRTLNELQRYFPAEQKTIDEIRRFREQMAMAALEEGISRGDIRDDLDPAIMLLTFTKTVLSPMEDQFLNANDITIHQLLEQMKKLLFYGILNRCEGDLINK
ncbi:TetR/AcrR family transcriptional regulator [Desulfosporosinus sp.]|uniref:TetR/AcrR family transcriptional regulator n=1 Tax=Desulfosporosinus sp. TaxID=157907 RepID=UPI000E82FF67|nr:TetR/AcrR family transcriptional regulator [Desulfosporosinus sp.]MBC2723920.1 TetR/AcrR family transcriptional regulator [Desulfosporosinus sp.]MBC2727132.1 TetR/AcrR family transcriptional regulator [Desulfosporosinus sp.]HBV86286.1 TetR/AcrR family transcriptional regulator [Desulfosporosinus sp.]